MIFQKKEMGLVKSGYTSLEWWHPKVKKNLTVDKDYIDNMRLNFNNDKIINYLPFCLESQKTEDEALAL